jgi:hypothetical protein
MREFHVGEMIECHACGHRSARVEFVRDFGSYISIGLYCHHCLKSLHGIQEIVHRLVEEHMRSLGLPLGSDVPDDGVV